MVILLPADSLAMLSSLRRRPTTHDTFSYETLTATQVPRHTHTSSAAVDCTGCWFYPNPARCFDHTYKPHGVGITWTQKFGPCPHHMEATHSHQQKSTTPRPSPSSRKGLTIELERRLLRDLEDHRLRDLKFADFCLLRPEYGASPLLNSIRNKVNFYKKLKRKNASRYWTLYAAASKGQQAVPPRPDYEDKDKFEQDDKSISSDSEQEDSSEDERYPSIFSTSSHRNWQSPTAQKRVSASGKTGQPTKQATQLSPLPPRTSVPSSSITMSTKDRRLAVASVIKPKGGGAKRDSLNEDQEMFESMEDAEEYGEYLCKHCFLSSTLDSTAIILILFSSYQLTKSSMLTWTFQREMVGTFSYTVSMKYAIHRGKK